MESVFYGFKTLKFNYMTNEKKDKIIDRVIDFLHNKPLKSDMRIAAALIEELKLVKNCSIPAVVGRSEQLCPDCGNTGRRLPQTLDSPDGLECECGAGA